MFEYYLLGIIVLPALLLAIYAQSKVTNTYRKYSKLNSKKGRTAKEVARTILDTAGLQNITIKEVKGNLTDYYDSKHKVLALSSGNINSTSVAAIGVAAHEAGHALQDKSHYLPFKLRHFVIHVSNFVSRAFIPLLIIGILLSIFVPTIGQGGLTLCYISAGMYAISMLVSLITLPVEFNASKRAIQILKDSSELDSEELESAKQVLSAAALTYVASFLYSLLEFLRILIWIIRIVGDRD